MTPLHQYKPLSLQEGHAVMLWREQRARLASVVVVLTLACIATYGAWQWSQEQSGFFDERSLQLHQSMTLMADNAQAPTESVPTTAPKPVGLKFVCYYSLPSQPDNQGLTPENVNASLCTHLIIAFAKVSSNHSLVPSGPRDFEDYMRVVKLKDQNANLKVLLSVQSEMAAMVVNHTTRNIFIKSCLARMKLYKLDGLDLDWEFPGDAMAFAKLIAELREAFGSRYLLTVAVAAPQPIVDISYKINIMSRYVDWVNLMTYDFHGYDKLTPFTGLNAPLYAGKNEHGFMAQLNTNWSAHYWESQGMPRSKIVVGIPTYCHTFTLVNMNNHGIGAPASGGGSFSHPDLCQFLLDGAAMVTDRFTRSPYAFKDKTWVSFENERSVAFKAEFAVNGRYAGAMIWSLNHDDYNGSCHNPNKKFPLTNRIRSVLKGVRV